MRNYILEEMLLESILHNIGLRDFLKAVKYFVKPKVKV